MCKKTGKSKKKEVDIMSTAVKLRQSDNNFIEEMDRYIRELENQKKTSQDMAYQEAKKALYRTGVGTKKGNIKKKIVSWE